MRTDVSHICCFDHSCMFDIIANSNLFCRCFRNGLRKVAPPPSSCTLCVPDEGTRPAQQAQANKAKKRAPAKPRARIQRPPSHSGRYKPGSRAGSWATAQGPQLAQEARTLEARLQEARGQLELARRRRLALEGAQAETDFVRKQLRCAGTLVRRLRMLGSVPGPCATVLQQALTGEVQLPLTSADLSALAAACGSAFRQAQTT